MILNFRLEDDILEEIISQLARVGRPDLIEELKNANDLDYRPPRRVKSDYYSDNEGSASSEEDYSVLVDAEGFHSLK